MKDIFNLTAYSRIGRRKQTAFDLAANFGSNMGRNFGEWLKSSQGKKKNFYANARPKSSSETDIESFITTEMNFNPMKLKLAEGYGFSVFPNSSSYETDVELLGFKSGSISDPFSGETVYFHSPEEYSKAITSLDEKRKNLLRERARAELLISGTGSPESVERIYEATAPLKNGKPVIGKDYKQKMQMTIRDAVLSHAALMSLSELKAFAAKYPGLNSIIKERETQLAKAKLSGGEAENITGREIEVKLGVYRTAPGPVKKFISEFKNFSHGEILSLMNALADARDSIKRNEIERSETSDYGVVDFKKTIPNDTVSQKELRDLLDWYSTIDLA